MLVQIRGDIGAGGAISATKIKIEDEIQDEVEFTGTIDDISSDSIVISGLTFRITDGLLVLNNQGVVVSVSSLNV